MDLTVTPASAAALARPAPRGRRVPTIVSALLTSKTGLPALLIVITVILCAVFAPWVAPHDPGTLGKLDIMSRLKPPFFVEGGSTEHLFGTDSIGRDILSRMIFAARISLVIGFASVAIAGTMGVLLGLISGYVGGRVDDLIMRTADIQLSLPMMFLAIFLMAVFGAGVQNVIIVLAVSNWVGYARVVRGQVLSLRAKEFVEAARVIGATQLSIMFKHILPNAMAPVIVIASFSVATTILVEAALSYLGLGVDPTTATWGSMLADGRDYITDAWWLTAFPGLAITFTVLGINLLGDWLRDYLDPRLKV